MIIIFENIRDYGVPLSLIGTSIAFVFSAYKFWYDKRTVQHWKEFEVFHKLVKELVEPPDEKTGLYVDRQAAILFELRNFRRYYPYSLRMLIGLREKWETPDQFPRLMEELNMTIEFLEKQNFDK